MSPRIKYYTDEHIPKAVIQGLRHRGMDVLSIPDAGMLGASDEKEMTKEPVRRIGKLEITVIMPEGVKIPEEYRARIERAAGKCPAKNSLHPDIPVDIRFIYP